MLHELYLAPINKSPGMSYEFSSAPAGVWGKGNAAIPLGQEVGAHNRSALHARSSSLQ